MFVEQVNQLAQHSLVTSCCPPHGMDRVTLLTASSHPGLQRMLWLKCIMLYLVTHCCGWSETEGSPQMQDFLCRRRESPQETARVGCPLLFSGEIGVQRSRLQHPPSRRSARAVHLEAVLPRSHTEMSERDPGPVRGGRTLRMTTQGQHGMKGCSSSLLGAEMRISFEVLLEIKGSPPEWPLWSQRCKATSQRLHLQWWWEHVRILWAGRGSGA